MSVAAPLGLEGAAVLIEHLRRARERASVVPAKTAGGSSASANRS
jgi:hypothetical protein